METSSEDELAGEQARNDEATNRWDADSEADARVASWKQPSKEGGETIITLYMREIGRVKLLTPWEGLELAARIKNGDVEAREQMIKANLRLVVKIARGYEGLGVPLLDLISEGNIGLMLAVERFDPGKGGKLSTYSAWWIKHAITRALACQSKATRLPTHVMEKLCRIRRTSVGLEEELGREATPEELAGELGTTAFGLARMRMAAMGAVSLVPDYRVSVAEYLIPASDVSEQISTAGYEASGTSNMKFMMNGALTIGTRDGATIEMAEAAGEENFFLFGLNAEQVEGSRGWYNPRWHYEHEPETRAALDLIASNHFSRNEPGIFTPIFEALLQHGDHYRHLADLASYAQAHQRLGELYADQEAWTRKVVRNIAASGRFSSDRTIAEYAREIWHAEPFLTERK